MGLHDGHRQRKRERFLKQGADGLADHEVLELLLYYAIPRRDTNELAHRLIQHFGTLDGQRRELLYQVCLDGKGKVLSCKCLSQGSADMTSLSIRQVVENALLSGAAGVVLGHNHPSGVALPSAEDRAATLQVRDALATMDIRLLDHIIVADGDFVSMEASGLLYG